jgi:hypothetical protein
MAEKYGVLTVGHNRESYPDQIRRIAADLTQVRHLWELKHAAEKLDDIAAAIENLLSAIPDEPQNPTDLRQFDP